MAALPNGTRGTGARQGAARPAGDDEAAASAEAREVVGNVGARLRTKRESLGMSLRRLGRELGVSASFLSQIELGKGRPSVATLYMICTALDLSLDELFSNGEPAPVAPVPPVAPAPAAPQRADHPHSPVVAPSMRRRLVLDSGVVWEQLSSMHDASIDFLYVTYDVGGSSTPDDRLTRHSGIEHGYIISGTLEVTLGFESFRLHPGDAISFDSATPHRLANVGEVPVEAIWFVRDRHTGLH
ncbi:helix-turn-helix transcriptional regulator [Streptosporangiaceae bacterium NEAU-GS5]|nr:helix-turn-helix transcriptional regulator [Streptosporangiaceae bacterium NEAU-GS5]